MTFDVFRLNNKCSKTNSLIFLIHFLEHTRHVLHTTGRKPGNFSGFDIAEKSRFYGVIDHEYCDIRNGFHKRHVSMILFFDTSAAGKVKNWKADPTDVFNWPRLIHLAWQMYDDERKLVSFGNRIIKPKGFVISSDVSRLCGVTMAQAEEEGQAVEDVLNEFNTEIGKADMIISFNLNFNMNILLCEYHRSKIRTNLDVSNSYCLMQESTYFCKLPARYGGYKWPTLTQLYAKIFQVRLEGLNQADTDVIASASCFYRLVDLGALEDLFDDE